MSNAEVQKLMDEARAEVEREDREAAVQELKEWIKKGRWERLRHPVYQRGIWHGMASAAIMFTMLVFLFGPLFFE